MKTKGKGEKTCHIVGRTVAAQGSRSRSDKFRIESDEIKFICYI